MRPSAPTMRSGLSPKTTITGAGRWLSRRRLLRRSGHKIRRMLFLPSGHRATIETEEGISEQPRRQHLLAVCRETKWKSYSCRGHHRHRACSWCRACSARASQRLAVRAVARSRASPCRRRGALRRAGRRRGPSRRGRRAGRRRPTRTAGTTTSAGRASRPPRARDARGVGALARRPSRRWRPLSPRSRPSRSTELPSVERWRAAAAGGRGLARDDDGLGWEGEESRTEPRVWVAEPAARAAAASEVTTHVEPAEPAGREWAARRRRTATAMPVAAPAPAAAQRKCRSPRAAGRALRRGRASGSSCWPAPSCSAARRRRRPRSPRPSADAEGRPEASAPAASPAIARRRGARPRSRRRRPRHERHAGGAQRHAALSAARARRVRWPPSARAWPRGRSRTPQGRRPRSAADERRSASRGGGGRSGGGGAPAVTPQYRRRRRRPRRRLARWRRAGTPLVSSASAEARAPARASTACRGATCRAGCGSPRRARAPRA